MLKLFEQLLLHLQQEVVVVLHFLRGVHHERADQVGAVRFVADAHRAGDGTKVHVVLVTGGEDGDGGVRDRMSLETLADSDPPSNNLLEASASEKCAASFTSH